jgi:hypothetical protein
MAATDLKETVLKVLDTDGHANSIDLAASLGVNHQDLVGPYPLCLAVLKPPSSRPCAPSARPS